MASSGLKPLPDVSSPSLGIYKPMKARSSSMITKILVLHTYTLPKGKQARNPAITCILLAEVKRQLHNKVLTRVLEPIHQELSKQGSS